MPLPKVQTSITLFGSPPWGFRISGGKEFNQPLVITRVTPGSLAHRSGVQSGDVVVAINNQFVSNLSQDECEAKVRQAVGSLFLVLEKNAAKVTELPGGQYQVEGDRSVYNATKEAQQKISKYNRSAKPFGAPEEEPGKEEDKNGAAKSGFRPISFKPKSNAAPAADATTALPARGDPDGVNSTSESMSKVAIADKDVPSTNNAPKKYNLSSYNRKPAPFTPANSSNNSNVLQQQDDFPPPPDFVENPQEVAAANEQFVSRVSYEPQKAPNPNVKSSTKKIVVGPNSALGLYSQENVDISYQAQVEDL